MLHRLALNTDLSAALADGVAPDWVELIPAGPTVTGRDGRTWTFDAVAAANVIDAFVQRDIDVAIDINHSLQLKAPHGDESPAAAWIDRLEMRDGVLWGHVSWTPRGDAAVTSRDYRWLSPVFDYDPMSNRIVRLVSAGLVNTPNLRLTALNHEDTQVTLSVALAAALGVPVDATDDTVVAAVNQLKTATAANSEKTNLERYVPRADYDALARRATNAEQALADYRKAEHTLAVDVEITAALKAGKITPATADYHRAMCSDQTSLQRFREYVAAAPVIAPDAARLDKKPEGSAAALNAEEQYVARALGLDPATFKDTTTHG